MLLLHPLPASAGLTFALCVLTFAPCILTFALCACFPPRSTGANMPLAQVAVATSCNLGCWCFFMQLLLAQIVHLHTWWYQHLQFVMVVLLHPVTGAKIVLALGQLALYIICRYGGLTSGNLRSETWKVRLGVRCGQC